MKTGIVSPVGFGVMGIAIVLGGFVAPLLAFLGSAFIAGAVRAMFEVRRSPVAVTAVRHHRAF